jgi:3beta-hydroxy-delta5-steroid dehydrogenase/steroid delta-isomerase
MNTAGIPAAPVLRAPQIGQHCLVTGGCGYVGSAIIQRLLAAGCTVRSFDIVKVSARHGVEHLQGDLNDVGAVQAACEGIDTVFHTAALIKLISLARPSVRRQVMRVNLDGTANILRAAAQAGVSAFVHTSTGNVVMDRVLENQDEYLPYATRTRDLYSVSKIAAEKQALAADEPDGMRVCAVRPGGLWGPNVQSVMIRSFLEQLAAGRFKATIGNGRSLMDNTHIENLVDGQLLAAKALRDQAGSVGGQAYFILDGEKINPMEWFRPLAEGLGYRYPRMRLPGTLMQGVAWLMELLHVLGGPEPVLSVRAVRNLIESSQFNIDKARRDLGYQPRYTRHNGLAEILPPARAFLAQQQRA